MKYEKYEHKSMAPYTPGGDRTALINSFKEHREKTRDYRRCWIKTDDSWVRSYKKEDVEGALLSMKNEIERLENQVAGKAA